MSQHYTANLTVHRVMKTEVNVANAPRNAVIETPKRETTEVLTVTVRAESLDKLKEKLIAHTGLLEEN